MSIHQNGRHETPLIFAFSRFKSKNDNAPKVARLDWPQLCELLSKRRKTRSASDADKDGPLLSGASYPERVWRREGNTKSEVFAPENDTPEDWRAPVRCNDFAELVSLAILDFDGGAQIESIKAGVSRLNNGAGAAAFIYSTFSHNPDAGAFKYRLVLPLLEPVASADYPDFWARLARAFDGAPDRAAKDAARIHYLPSCPKSREQFAESLELYGEPLDASTLPALPVEPRQTPIFAPQNAGGDLYARAAFEKEIGRLCATTTHRNQALNDTARRLGQFIGAGRLDRAEVEAALWNAASSYIKKDGEAQARATMQSGLNDGVREPNFKGMPSERGAVSTSGAKALASPKSGEPGERSEEAAPLWTLTSLRELRARPRPLWLIQDILVEATAVVLSGDSQSFKTFSALDMALCVATGTKWQGREVKRGPVVYIAAEGGWTLRDRLEAWEIARGFEVADEDFQLLEIPVTIGEAATVAAFSDFIKAGAPRLVVIDTLSACAEGLKENASEDMATFVRHMKAIARATGATVIVIHHNNKGGDLRGAVSLKNDADTHITFEREGEEDELTTLVSCSKHRGVHFSKFALRGEEITLSEPDEYGRPVSSLVFEPCDVPEIAPAAPRPVDKKRERLLEIFDEIADEYGGTVRSGTWSARAEEARVCESSSAFHRHRKALVKGTNKSADESRDNGPILCEGSVYRRRAVSPTSPTSPTSQNGTNGSEGTKAPDIMSHFSHIPLGMGEVGHNNGSAGSGKSGKARERKARAATDSEPYSAAANSNANATTPGAFDEEAAGVDV